MIGVDGQIFTLDDICNSCSVLSFEKLFWQFGKKVLFRCKNCRSICHVYGLSASFPHKEILKYKSTKHTKYIEYRKYRIICHVYYIPASPSYPLIQTNNTLSAMKIELLQSLRPSRLSVVVRLYVLIQSSNGQGS